MRKRLPSATEIVYDNYNALAFGPSERASEAILSIALFPKWVNLFFLQGVGLPDPGKRLQGSGNVVRHIRLNGPESLDEPGIAALFNEALRRAKVPLDPNAPQAAHHQVGIGEATPPPTGIYTQVIRSWQHPLQLCTMMVG